MNYSKGKEIEHWCLALYFEEDKNFVSWLHIPIMANHFVG